jgi:signal transduction histidine kinase
MGVLAPATASVRPAVTAPHLLLVAAIMTCALAIGAWLVVLAYTGDVMEPRGLRAALACWLTLPYVLAGVVAWRRRPDSRLGPLMVTAGFVTALTFFNWSDDDLAFTLGLLFQFLPPALYLHLFLSFPDGRLHTRFERGVVVAAYVVACLKLPRLLLGEDGDRSLLAAADAPDAVMQLRNVQLAAMSVLLLTGTVLLVRRRLRAGRPVRRWLGHLVDAFAVALPMISLLYLVQLLGWTGALEPVRQATFAMIGLAPMVFLAGMLDARLGRASVAQLVVDLGVKPNPTELQAAVIRALRDPSARLAYWLPEYEAFADVDGRPVPPGSWAELSATPVVRDETLVARLHHDPALDEEPQLLTSVAAAVGMSIQNARLQVELRARLEDLRDSRSRILAAEQHERRRLERDLHDGAQQRLVGLSLELGELAARPGLDPAVRDAVRTAVDEVTASLADLRDLAHGIHPAVLSDHGLSVAVETLATRSAVPVRLVAVPAERLPVPVELAAFYVVSEALTNVARHAAGSVAAVAVRRRPGFVVVDVTDDGVGGATADAGTGLRGLADRVEALGGTLQLWSPAGVGTHVRADIPCA